MRVELDLPDWVDERHIRVFAGIELVAIKEAHENFWKVKENRCIMCGKCCTNFKHHFFPLVNGECIHLEPENKQGNRACRIAINRPFQCGNDPRPDKCKNITHKKVPCK